jgi:RES domain
LPIASFPAVSVTVDVPLWRCHRAGVGPWWFASDGGGRFDLRAPRGTCYLGEDPLVAVVEALSHAGPDGVAGTTIDRADLKVRCLRELRLPVATRTADATDGKALGFGVTREIHDTVDYDMTQGWARAWGAAHFDGVHYLPTNHQPVLGHTPWQGPGAQGPGSLAVFGAAGERTRWRRGRAKPLDADIEHQLETTCSVLVEDRPSAAQLSID